jgi:hypothetical protein
MGVEPRLLRLGLHRFTGRQFEPYVKAIGQLTLAWNSLQEAMAHTFEILLTDSVRPSEYDKALQIRAAWHAARSDHTQRQMLLAAASNATGAEIRGFPKLATDLIWVVKKVDDLSVSRNAIIHSPLTIVSGKANELAQYLWPDFRSDEPDRVVPVYMTGNQLALRLSQKDLLAEFRWCRDSALVYRDFVAHINRALGSAGYSWPNRPAPPTRPPQRTLSQKRPPARKG